MQLGGSSLVGGPSATTNGGTNSGAISAQALISSQDWKNAHSGQQVQLTEEERRTLVAEGYPIPQRFPLSKAEERSLKKIRRKIKNKISAQESRRKKKEYMEELEKKVQHMELRIVELERENQQLKQQQVIGVGGAGSIPSSIDSSSIGTKHSSKHKADTMAANTIKLEPRDCDEQLMTNNQQDGAANNLDARLATATEQQQQQPQRKISTATANGLQATDDDYFIDDILMSQERQEAHEQLADDDLVANLVGVVCESDDMSVVKSICDQINQDDDQLVDTSEAAASGRQQRHQDADDQLALLIKAEVPNGATITSINAANELVGSL